jgi:altronate dehydratase small subunit
MLIRIIKKGIERMLNAIIIDPKDNVAVAIETIKKGEAIKIGNIDEEIEAQGDILIYHKLALKDIDKDSAVIKYGEEIGIALADIKKGSHVHVHNVESKSLYEGAK